MRAVPGTDLSTFELALGGNVFGWSADEAESFAVLDAYAQAGGNHLDTADVYSAWQGTTGGESETIIGRWMAARGNRDDLLLATKVGKAPGLDNLRPETIRTAVEGSLRRLQTDRIDLYYAHQDHDDPMDATLEAFDGLVRAGKVRWLAASNFSAARLGEALDLSASRGWAAYAAAQPEYHLMARAAYEGELAPVLAARGMGAFPYFGLAKGFLTGKYRAGDVVSVRAGGVAQYAGERGDRVLAALDAIAAAHGVTMGAVALAWLASRPGVLAPIASARTATQLAELLPMADLALAPDELDALNRASDPSSSA